MADLITFYLVIKYQFPSKEWLFLEKGWGVRDVRGPYLNALTGHICIGNEVLLPEIPTIILLTISLSNRCPTSSLLVQALASDRIITHSVNRNDSCDFAFQSVLSNPNGKFRIEISIPSVKNSTDLKEYCDIVAIDEITIERSR